MPKILMPLADGFEDIEAMAVVDILRRAGINVVIAGLPGNIVTSLSKVRVHTDTRLLDEDLSKFDGIVLPGGSAAVATLEKTPSLTRALQDYAKAGKFIAAICAAPAMLNKLGVLKDKKATAYPGMERGFERPRTDRVVVDGNIVTSQGPGTAVAFALKIVEQLMGREVALRISQQVVA
ncbi:MAG: DJ-1/PfpI family protein [Candidatus Aenigmatarchaeota archaeon]|nr:DJ-1/PfpI family protein [Candidatus Aenigmarchaeota archaeon]